MNDPIVDEVRRVRDAHAASFNYDLDAIFRDIKERERKSGREFIRFSRNGMSQSTRFRLVQSALPKVPPLLDPAPIS